MRTLLAGFVAGSALLVLPSASAKDFHPGDLRVCNKVRCIAIENRAVLPRLGSFYYSGPSPARAAGPKLGVPYYELRFRNGYVTGIVATRQLDRFLSYGVYLERFARNRWYAVPYEMSRELRRLTVGRRPLRLTQAALAKSRWGVVPRTSARSPPPLEEAREPRGIPELNVRLRSWWRLIDDADPGRRRLTLFPHVAP